MVRSFAAAVVVTALLGVSQAHAQNVALSTDGASFVSASSALDPTAYNLTYINGSLATGEANLLTTTPTAYISDGDTRYLFADSDLAESLTIDLGQTYSDLQSFGVTWFDALYHDRAPISVAVLVSTTGLAGSFTEVGSTDILPYGGSEFLFSFDAPITAQYVMYDFGEGFNGSGIAEVFADVPEPASAAALIVGLATVMMARRRRGKPACARVN